MAGELGAGLGEGIPGFEGTIGEGEGMKCAKCGRKMSVYVRHITPERAREIGELFAANFGREPEDARAGTYRLHSCPNCQQNVVEAPSPNEVISRS